MKVRAIIDYVDMELDKEIKIGDEYEVTKERAEVLLKGNISSHNKPFVEVVKEEIETANLKTDNVEKAIKPRKKKEKRSEDGE